MMKRGETARRAREAAREVAQKKEAFGVKSEMPRIFKAIRSAVIALDQPSGPDWKDNKHWVSELGAAVGGLRWEEYGVKDDVRRLYVDALQGSQKEDKRKTRKALVDLNKVMKRVGQQAMRYESKSESRATEGMLDAPLQKALREFEQIQKDLADLQSRAKQARNTMKTSPHYKQDDGGLRMYTAIAGRGISGMGSAISELDTVVIVLGKMNAGAWNEPFKK